MNDAENKYAIYGHLTAKDGKSATEVTPMIQSDETTAQGAVEQKIAIDKQRSKITYDAMIKSANEVLFAAKTVFPFTIFPTTIVIDRNQVNIKDSVFLGVHNFHTFLLRDINNIQVTKGILFSMVHFEVNGYEHAIPDVNYLRNSEAEQIKKIIDAIHIAQASQVDITQLEKTELLNLAKKITYQNNFKNAPI
jgi:hypothetical protein